MTELHFELAVWHPFGPHGRESATAIIQRKRREIEANGWTLWSFQHRRTEVLNEWSQRLSATTYPIAFCSDSRHATDPAETGDSIATMNCRSYRPALCSDWMPCPEAVNVPHPFKPGKTQAAAFIVRKVICPFEMGDLPEVEWLSNGLRRDASLPTRGEYLIRRGGSKRMRAVFALLELQAPFVASVRSG